MILSQRSYILFHSAFKGFPVVVPKSVQGFIKRISAAIEFCASEQGFDVRIISADSPEERISKCGYRGNIPGRVAESRKAEINNARDPIFIEQDVASAKIPVDDGWFKPVQACVVEVTFKMIGN